MSEPKCFVIIPAAGSGSRMHAKLPKQYLPIHGKPILSYTLANLSSATFFQKIVLVVPPLDTRAAVLTHGYPNLQIVTGGEKRVDSVRNGLHALATVAAPEDWIFVHDAARPLISRRELEALHEVLTHESVGAILAVPVRDTLKRCDAHGIITGTVDRSRLWAAQTPQVFRYDILKKALSDDTVAFTDEASAVEKLGLSVRVVEGNVTNFKITYPEDLRLASLLLNKESVCE